jgi:hypothetical protein
VQTDFRGLVKDIEMINSYPKCLGRAMKARAAELLNGLQVQECGVAESCLKIRGGRKINRGLPADGDGAASRRMQR